MVKNDSAVDLIIWQADSPFGRTHALSVPAGARRPLAWDDPDCARAATVMVEPTCLSSSTRPAPGPASQIDLDDLGVAGVFPSQAGARTGPGTGSGPGPAVGFRVDMSGSSRVLLVFDQNSTRTTLSGAASVAATEKPSSAQSKSAQISDGAATGAPRAAAVEADLEVEIEAAGVGLSVVRSGRSELAYARLDRVLASARVDTESVRARVSLGQLQVGQLVNLLSCSVLVLDQSLTVGVAQVDNQTAVGSPLVMLWQGTAGPGTPPPNRLLGLDQTDRCMELEAVLSRFAPLICHFALGRD